MQIVLAIQSGTPRRNGWALLIVPGPCICCPISRAQNCIASWIRVRYQQRRKLTGAKLLQFTHKMPPPGRFLQGMLFAFLTRGALSLQARLSAIKSVRGSCWSRRVRGLIQTLRRPDYVNMAIQMCWPRINLPRDWHKGLPHIPVWLR